jgi:transposase-like protein
MSRTRRTFGKDFKAKVVLEALKRKIPSRYCKKYELLPNQISMWKSSDTESFCSSAEKLSLPKMKFNRETLCSNRSADLENDF